MTLFNPYREGLTRGGYQSAFDEMFAEHDPLTARPPYQALFDRLQALTAADFKRRVALADATLLHQGITFTVYGDAAGVERTFPVDLIPRIVPADEWETIERGLTQRINALNLFLRDLYSDAHILKDGIIPRELIESAEHYRKSFIGCKVPHDVYVHICGTDLIRDESGQWIVLEDNLRTPSGVSYVLENRQMLMRIFPQMYSSIPIRPVDHYTTTLLENLRALSPRQQPTVVLLTPGVYNSAYFEHAFLAQQMGIELVQGSDLLRRRRQRLLYEDNDNGPQQRVDVIYRRIDDDFLDPETFPTRFRHLVCRGLMRAYAVGQCCASPTPSERESPMTKLFISTCPDIIRYYLGEDALAAVCARRIAPGTRKNADYILVQSR